MRWTVPISSKLAAMALLALPTLAGADDGCPPCRPPCPPPPRCCPPPCPPPCPPAPCPPPCAPRASSTATPAGARPVEGAPKATLFVRLGGRPVIEAVTDDFLARLLKDTAILANPQVKARAAAIDAPSLRGHLIDQLVQATGGPAAYHGRDMRSAHAGLRITEAEWNAAVADLVATLAVFRVPDAERGELLALLAPLKGDIVQPSRSLYERLGGLKAIETFTDAFLARLTKNPRVMGNEAVARRIAAVDADAVRMHLIAFVAKATGGPVAYTGRDMTSAHAGMKITAEEWAAAGEDFVATLVELNVPEAEQKELLALVAPLEAQIVGK